METCSKCDGNLPARKPGPGRPPSICAACKEQKTATCLKCGVVFTGPKNRRYCTARCRERAKQNRKERRQRERRKFAEPVVYFIQAEGGGPIKIGIASSPGERLRELQTASPYRLVLRKLIPGGAGGEKALHALFAHARLEGEWFEPVPELLALIT